MTRVHRRAGVNWRRACTGAILAGWMLAGFGPASLGCESTAPQATRPDPRIRTHVVEPSTPTPEGLAYMVQMARALEDAAQYPGEEQREARAATLRRALALPVPGDLAEAEIVRLEAATLLAETLLETPEGAPVARDLLRDMVPVERSLPMDRATARALATLGDAATETGDDALAAGSYARAIRIMSLLRQELEP